MRASSSAAQHTLDGASRRTIERAYAGESTVTGADTTNQPRWPGAFLATYNTIDEFIAGDFATIGFTDIGIAADFSICDFTMELQLDDPAVRVSEPSSIGSRRRGGNWGRMI